ncbi:LOW QUALITY PROTEIN: hypothetical protein PHMEG_00011700 [Phytophthora megakarya]|uniref:DDE Tnp4 domain-containing protein n=1 Tax=Phytophthora megakarya TaxID=4795 RepID=A0A225WAM4_9STRA|nr:LOW QUALITY PROTEIN: hypothetical protein PHMEG_00011700 [Phytophthora megakarya]
MPTVKHNHLLKTESEKELNDEGLLGDKYPDSWVVLADKGYQGLAEDFRAVTPFRKLPLQTLTPNQVETNDRIAHDRVIVENYFEHLCTLWSMFSDKYRWDEANCDITFKACIALTNFHVRILPLRSHDGDNYRNYLKRLHVIGNDARTKRLLVQRRYREKRKLRLRRLLTANVERTGGTMQSDSSSDIGSEDFLRRHIEAFFETG